MSAKAAEEPKQNEMEEKNEQKEDDQPSQESTFLADLNLVMLLWASARSYEEIMDTTQEDSNARIIEESKKMVLSNPNRRRHDRIEYQDMAQRRPKCQTRMIRDIRHSRKM
ncbi:hypothetical protein ACHQM5_000331 [Ranunculus cassubicifolius]